MNKSELKTGMWVIHRNGEERMVLLGTENGDILAGSMSWGEIRHYDENFNHDHIKEYDIMVIYTSNAICRMHTISKSRKVWQRTEAKEITSEEAFSILKKHYGCEVKIKE